MTDMDASQHHHRVDIAGLVGRPGPVELSGLAAVRRRTVRLVPAVELLAHAQLDVAAEVLVVVDTMTRSIAVPVRDVLASGCRLVLARHGRVSLFVPGWTEDERGFPMVSLLAMTFAGFLGLSAPIDLVDPS
jgi:hypothetical protein